MASTQEAWTPACPAAVFADQNVLSCCLGPCACRSSASWSTQRPTPCRLSQGVPRCLTPQFRTVAGVLAAHGTAQRLSASLPRLRALLQVVLPPRQASQVSSRLAASQKAKDAWRNGTFTERLHYGQWPWPRYYVPVPQTHALVSRCAREADQRYRQVH